MQGWQTRLNERKAQFLNKTRQKVAEMRELLAHLATQRSDSAALTKVNKHFHQLGGAGGIYEMTEFCNFAIAGEDLCTKLLACGAPVGTMEHTKLQALCDMLVKSLDKEQQKIKTEEGTAGSGDTAHGASVRKLDVLLVDGNGERLVAWHRMFEEQKMAVRTVKTASGARGTLLIRVPDVMVINAPLPDSPFAFDVIQHLRGMSGGDKTVVLIVTERAAFKDKVDAIRCGADSLVEGEVSAKEVLAKANEMLGRRQNKRFKILSVEDDPEQAYFIKTTLESVGYTVLHIPDAGNFEDALNSFAPDLVLLDIMLGDISGHDLARFVRNHEQFNALPIVFLTTENQLHMHVESARAGGDEHLVKPISPQLLVATIAGRLDRDQR